MKTLETTAEMLKNRGYEVYVYETAAEGVEKALSLIPEKSSVSWGGSMSVVDSGLLDKVKAGNYVLIDRDTAQSKEERVEIMRKGLTADYFLCSFNALAKDGTVINIDGNGNRVAAISYGPKYVIALVGANKITETEEEGLVRARTVAAPKNAVRFGMDPSKADSICNIIQILKNGGNGRIKVILVNEELGY